MSHTLRIAARPSSAAALTASACIMLLGAAACGGDDPRGADSAAVQPDSGVRSVKLAEGMTMEEVLAAWGRPNVKVRDGVGERWSYWVRDTRQRVVARTYVFFDEHGRVLEVVTRPGDIAPDEPRAPVTITRSAGREARRG